jgi:hypothetical protein
VQHGLGEGLIVAMRPCIGGTACKSNRVACDYQRPNIRRVQSAVHNPASSP